MYTRTARAGALQSVTTCNDKILATRLLCLRLKENNKNTIATRLCHRCQVSTSHFPHSAGISLRLFLFTTITHMFKYRPASYAAGQLSLSTKVLNPRIQRSNTENSTKGPRLLIHCIYYLIRFKQELLSISPSSMSLQLTLRVFPSQRGSLHYETNGGSEHHLIIETDGGV